MTIPLVRRLTTAMLEEAVTIATLVTIAAVRKEIEPPATQKTRMRFAWDNLAHIFIDLPRPCQVKF